MYWSAPYVALHYALLIRVYFIQLHKKYLFDLYKVTSHVAAAQLCLYFMYVCTVARTPEMLDAIDKFVEEELAKPPPSGSWHITSHGHAASENGVS
jgi:hypothetical protein